MNMSHRWLLHGDCAQTFWPHVQTYDMYCRSTYQASKEGFTTHAKICNHFQHPQRTTQIFSGIGVAWPVFGGRIAYYRHADCQHGCKLQGGVVRTWVPLLHISGCIMIVVPYTSIQLHVHSFAESYIYNQMLRGSGVQKTKGTGRWVVLIMWFENTSLKKHERGLKKCYATTFVPLDYMFIVYTLRWAVGLSARMWRRLKRWDRMTSPQSPNTSKGSPPKRWKGEKWIFITFQPNWLFCRTENVLCAWPVFQSIPSQNFQLIWTGSHHRNGKTMTSHVWFSLTKNGGVVGAPPASTTTLCNWFQ